MTIEQLRDYCLAKPYTTESFPFDQQTLVFKVDNKMFALADVENFTSVNLKCDPERAIVLREEYFGIIPGWHMSKTHWNTVKVGEDVSNSLFFELVDLSYDLVVQSLTKKRQRELGFLD
ncbi:MAG: MmcQ/YjbR family DNA-binding protein [Bacteroidota bacterium]